VTALSRSRGSVRAFSATESTIMNRISLTVAACGLPAVIGAFAAAPAVADDLSDMRQEIQGMRQQYEQDLRRMQKDYESRLQQMERRVRAAEAKAEAAQKASSSVQPLPPAAVATAQAVPPTEPEIAAAAPTPVAASPPIAVPGGAPASAGAFNPAIGVVLMGQTTAQTRDPNDFRIPGFALGDAAGQLPRGFALNESEVNLSANVDQALYGNLTLAFERNNTVGVEEGFLQTTSLPYGLTLKGGRFFSGIGYLNEQHAHTWDFADPALPYQAFLNTQYDDDGVQVRWLAPTDRFLEFGTEAFRGDFFPAGGTDNHNLGVGAWSAFVHTGDDIGDSASYRVGLSHLWTTAKNRTTNGLDGTDRFSGTDHTYIVDATYKWAPNGNFVDRYLKLQGEFFLRQEQGVFNASPHFASTQTGFYAQAVYQFMPQWRAGLRYDQVNANTLAPGFAGSTLDTLGATPRRYSGMLDYSTSEFGRFRLQYDLNQLRPQTDHELILQYIVSLGAHGAHQY
jgi:hypothetical protein